MKWLHGQHSTLFSLYLKTFLLIPDTKVQPGEKNTPFDNKK
jgi:hypothetical protein